MALALLGVALGLSQAAELQPPRWVKVWGGPTEGPAPLSLRIAVIEREPPLDASEAASSNMDNAKLVVRDEQGERHSTALSFDSDGVAFVTLPRLSEHPFISIELEGVALGAGRIHLERSSYASGRRSRGGLLHGKVEGPLQLSVGMREGVVALGIPGRLGISVLDQAGKALACSLALHFDGLELLSQGASLERHAHATDRALTDVTGRASLRVIPIDLAASVEVVATVASSDEARRTDAPSDASPPTIRRADATSRDNAWSTRFYASVPVEARSLRATLHDERVLIDSLVPLEKSYFALVNDEGRWDAGAIAMRCNAQASCTGEAPITRRPSGPSWIMVGTEPSLDGPNVIGWPVADEPFIAEAVVFPERLLLDGKPAAMKRLAEARARRFTFFMFGLAIAIATLLLAVALPIWRERRNLARLNAALPEGVVGRRFRTGALAAALLAVLAGVALLSLSLWMRWKLLGH